MDDQEQLEDLVSHGDALAAIKTIHGQHATILDFTVKPATSSVQGFLSLILRVRAKVQVSPGVITQSSFIVKRLPIIQEHLELMEDSDLFDREILVFNKVVPMLKNKIPNLNVVQCLAAYNDTIIMEDLCDSGYETVSSSMKQVGSSLTIAHVRLAIRKLAEFHAASLDIDWLEEIPFLKKDALFEGHGRKMMEPVVDLGCKSIVEILKEFYPDLDQKYSEWLLSPKCYDNLISFVKPSDKYLNVLGHGDFWENNMMFKLDPENKKPIDVKFIDLQLIRYSPATCDLFYFLYLCTDKKFRDVHETEILNTYVAAFNNAVCETPDHINSTVLARQYEDGKLFGALFGATMKPMLFIESVFPGDKETMTKEQFDQIMFGVEPEIVLEHFKENSNFNAAMRLLIDELIEEMKKSGVCEE